MSHLVRRLASACALLAVLLVPAAASAAVNLNTATFDELVAVTGIGPKKAQQIIEHRESKGPFKSVDDLKQIKGFRDILLHRYFEINVERVWQAVEKLPALRAAVEALLAVLPPDDDGDNANET